MMVWEYDRGSMLIFVLVPFEFSTLEREQKSALNLYHTLIPSSILGPARKLVQASISYTEYQIPKIQTSERKAISPLLSTTWPRLGLYSLFLLGIRILNLGTRTKISIEPLSYSHTIINTGVSNPQNTDKWAQSHITITQHDVTPAREFPRVASFRCSYWNMSVITWIVYFRTSTTCTL
jgi:hypothetical protein